jgi:hypothetical protein
MPPHYVIGKCGSYLAATVDQVDKHLRGIRTWLKGTVEPRRAANLRHDLDLLLDRRAELVVAQGDTINM